MNILYQLVKRNTKLYLRDRAAVFFSFLSVIIIIVMYKRNTKLYLRDRAAVFFSFLSVIIIIVMYVLFLGRINLDNLPAEVQEVEGIEWLVNSWIMAGLLTVSTVTVPLGALGILIHDRQHGKINDFYTSPIDRKVLALSYLISAWVIGFIMVFLNFVVGQIYIVLSGGELLDFLTTIKLMGVVMLSIIAFSSFFFYIALLMKTQNAFGLLSTLVGTFIGFLGGIYIPIGILSEGVQTFMNVLPSAHSVTLIRNIYMKGVLNEVFEYAPQEVYDNYVYMNGLTAKINDYHLESYQLVASLIVFALVFYIFSVVKLSKSKL